MKEFQRFGAAGPASFPLLGESAAETKPAVASDWGPEAVAMLAIAAWLVCFRTGPFINDVGWQLWIGRQINGGAELYVDILEVNPPLWFWFAAVVQKIATAIGVPPLHLLTATFAAAAAASILLCRLILPNERERAAIYAALVLALFLTSSYALGQRDQFALVTTLPYVALIAMRAEGRSIRPSHAVCIALFAALGFALKHYFALVPLALEAWLIWRCRILSVRSELVVLALAATAYAAAIALLTPGYLTTMIPLIAATYHAFDQDYVDLLRHPPLYAAALAVMIVCVRRKQAPALASAAAVATVAFAAIFIAQAKGFEYHAVPALGTALASIFVSFVPRRGDRLPREIRLLVAAAMACALLTPFLAGPPRYDGAAAKATAAVPDGAPLTVITASGVAAWPLVEERGLTWHSRHMMLWMMPAFWRDQTEGRLDPVRVQIARAIRAEVAAEIACFQPPVVLVDLRYNHAIAGGDILGFFRQDPNFIQAMSSYERAPDVDYLQVWRRASSRPGQPSRNGCLRPA